MLPGSTVDERRDFLRTISLAAFAASAADWASIALAHTAVSTCRRMPCTEENRGGEWREGEEVKCKEDV